MKIVLLGPNGQLGSDILEQNSRLSRPLEIEAIGRNELDISDGGNIGRVLSERTFNAVINCTSFHKTDEVEANGTFAVAVNATAPRELARLCAVKGAKLLHISTDYVFGGYKPSGPLRETDSPAPVNVYGATKLLGENLSFANHDNVLILRVASLFGVHGASGKGGNFVETMIKLGRERGMLKVVADQAMSPTATADVAKWILGLLQGEAPAGLYHAVNSGAATWYEFASAIIDITETRATVQPISTKEFPLVAMRPSYSALSNSKLAEIVGPIRGWREALTEYLKVRGYI